MNNQKIYASVRLEVDHRFGPIVLTLEDGQGSRIVGSLLENNIQYYLDIMSKDMYTPGIDIIWKEKALDLGIVMEK